MFEELLNEWNPWWSKKYTYKGIVRPYLKDLNKLMSLKHIMALLGVRRAGKTHLMYQIIDHLLSKGISSSNIFFIKVDDLRIKDNLGYNKINMLIEEYKIFQNPKGKIFLFMDEIHELEDWQQYLKTIYDLNDNYKIVVSGSNAHMLKKDVSDYLTGRVIEKKIFPFSFKEYLIFKNIKTDSKKNLFENKLKIRREFNNFLFNGGFPETIDLDDDMRVIILKEYFQTILFKDVISRYSVSNSSKILDFAHYIISNSTKPFNFSNLAKQFSYSNDTVSDYISYFEEVFFIFRVFIMDYSIKKQLVNPKKLYCIDNGIITASSFKFSKDYGRLLENLVFIELLRQDKQVYYHNNKGECDFVSRKDNKIVDLIQVTKELAENKDREINGLIEAMKYYKLKEGFILTENEEDEITIETFKIKVFPIWKWLLIKYQ